MTHRSAHADPPGYAEPDFTRLDCTAARKRVRQLITVGLAESQVGDLVGWDLDCVRRACTERHAAAPIIGLVCDANE